MGRGTSDETLLETFVETLVTLPAEVRRNLELMKDLDQTTAKLFDEMVILQQEYVQRVESKIGSLEVVENGTKVRVLGQGENRPAIVPTTEELLAFVSEPETLERIDAIEEDTLQQAEEKVSIAEQNFALIDNVCKRLDADMEEMRRILQHSGEFQKPGAAKPDDLAAVQVTPNDDTWILAKVITYDPETGIFCLADEDIESNKIFNLPESQVVILGDIKNPNRGDTVFAVYPDTTSFYQATITQPARKVSGGGGNFVMVQFLDDSDEMGITHDKAVDSRYIMRPPY